MVEWGLKFFLCLISRLKVSAPPRGPTPMEHDPILHSWGAMDSTEDGRNNAVPFARAWLRGS